MNKELLIAAGIMVLIFILIRWRAAHTFPAPLRRLSAAKRRELVQLQHKLQQAADQGDANRIYYYDSLQMGIIAIYLPELSFLEARHALNKWQERFS